VSVCLVVIVQTKNIRVGRKEWEGWCDDRKDFTDVYKKNIFSRPLKWKRQRFKRRDCGHVYDVMWFLESLFLELFKLFLSSSCGRDCVLSSTFKSTLSHTQKSWLSWIFNMGNIKRRTSSMAWTGIMPYPLFVIVCVLRERSKDLFYLVFRDWLTLCKWLFDVLVFKKSLCESLVLELFYFPWGIIVSVVILSLSLSPALS